MRMSDPGMTRYMFETLIFSTIRRAQSQVGVSGFTVSEGRRLREAITAELRTRLNLDGISGDVLDNPAVTPGLMMQALDTTLTREIPGYLNQYDGEDAYSGKNVTYNRVREQFLKSTGTLHLLPNGKLGRLDAGNDGPRLPLSPYDPRWARNEAVRQGGTVVSYARVMDIASAVTDADGETLHLNRLHESPVMGVEIYRPSERDDRGLQAVGEMFTVESASGLTELQRYMSRKEYEEVAPFLLRGAGAPGAEDWSKFMSAHALASSLAILRELQSQGVEYKVSPDLRPGQLKVSPAGTRLDIRLTDVRDQEHYVGRAYHDGVQVYYSFSGGPGGSQMPNYVATADEAAALMRVAQGLPVERSDGKGEIGVVDREAGKPMTYYTRAVNDGVVSARKPATLMVGRSASQPGSRVVIMQRTENRVPAWQNFLTTEAAQLFIDDAVISARANVVERLDVDGLVTALADNFDEAVAGEYFPEFDGDVEIAAIQRSYWDVLRGAQDTLLRPGAEREDYFEQTAFLKEVESSGEAREAMHDLMAGSTAYTGADREGRVRAHHAELLNHFIGLPRARMVIDPESGEEVIESFDAVRVATFMESTGGPWRNTNDLVSALRVLGDDGSSLKGESFYSSVVVDRLVEFDEDSARDVNELEDSFTKRMVEQVRDAVSRNAVENVQVAIDDHGIVRWQGDRIVGQAGELVQVTGHIGQIFEPGTFGEIRTDFAGTDNYMFVPGYEASIVTQRAGEDLSMEERTRLRGLEQVMGAAIARQIRVDLIETWSQVGEPASVNAAYRQLHDTRHELDFMERSAEEGMSPEMAEAILRSEGRRVRYSNDIRDGSTINAEYEAENGREVDLTNDNFDSAWLRTGERNMAVLDENSNGFYDPVMTSGGTNQGVVRYLVDSAVVEADGSITRGELDDRAPLMKLDALRHGKFNPVDREQMTVSNVLQGAAITEPVNVAMTTVGGWTADDGIVISSNFAAQYQVRGAGGEMRDLIVGDKLSDLHGNKGVIALIVERGELESESADPEVQRLFELNPDLDVVTSPFSPVSRFNGGTARELMENPQELVLTDGTVVPGGMGSQALIVTHMVSDKKTVVYDDQALAQGRGRRAGAQLAWALTAQEAESVMAEFYGPNASGFTTLREMLITMGLDIEPDGTLRVGLDPLAAGAARNIFEVPSASIGRSSLNREFAKTVGERGGELVLPFPLDMPSGIQTPVHESDANGKAISWRLPVMSKSLRTGQEMAGGKSTAHDYTLRYLRIYQNAAAYSHNKAIADDSSTPRDKRGEAQKKMADARDKASLAYGAITGDLKMRRFKGKRNVFKESIMSARVPNSATAVWSADPRLELDEVGMGPVMAKSLGFREGDHAIIWRDPILRDGGVRALRVKIDPRLMGVSIHPAMDKSFDGDFDGDAVAVVRLTTPAAKAEALEKLSVPANLLDLGSCREDGTYDLAMQNSLDTKVSQSRHEGMADHLESLRLEANDNLYDLQEGEIDQAEFLERNKGVLRGLTDFYHDALHKEYGGATLRFDNVRSHLDSVKEACIDTGAKGSVSKLADYEKYVGVTSVRDAEGNIVSLTDHGDTLHTAEDNRGVFIATSVKSFGTGLAGMVSQRAVAVLRNAGITEALELTQPVTQAVLQSKHDPIAAKKKYDALKSYVRELWRGRAMVGVGAGDEQHWVAATDKKGNSRQATSAEWAAMFNEIYTSPQGLNVSVNPAFVDRVSQLLSINGQMVDIEDPATYADKEELGSTLDALAYGGDFDTVLEAAKKNEALFEGRFNVCFAPSQVRANIERLAEGSLQADVMETIAPKDVMADVKLLPKRRSTGFARTVKAPAPAMAEPIEVTPAVIEVRVSEHEARVDDTSASVEHYSY